MQHRAIVPIGGGVCELNCERAWEGRMRKKVRRRRDLSIVELGIVA
jgi:hypothetical protein